MPEKIYNIQEVADFLGLYKGTIVNYENRHIFPKAHRNPINNYREYAKEDIEGLRKILKRGR
ncbi:MAG: MerR family transcriptional regulator [Candidatus Omnitrophica bacterium]|nr:MerR family transcriptional regulator [Candidatus Omnitrophota bacterium]